MSADTGREVHSALREIRDGQREVIALRMSQRALATNTRKKSREQIDASVGLQRVALERQKPLTLIAVPAILACIAGIMYLMIRYF